MCYGILILADAAVAELADALDSGSSPDCQGGGSSPFCRTKPLFYNGFELHLFPLKLVKKPRV
jgi:hypothetical protein